MTNLEKLLAKYRNSPVYLYKIGHVLCYAIFQDCRRCPVRHRKAGKDGIVHYYCGERYEDFVKMGKWAVEEAKR